VGVAGDHLYLAQKHGPGTLYPATLEGQAKAAQRSLWAANEIERATNVWSFHAQRLPPAERDPKIAAAAIELLAPPFRVLDGALAGQPYLLGQDFTVADLNVAAVALRAIAMDLSATPHFGAWLRRCYERPAAQKVSRMREEAEAGAALETTREAARRNRL
jgi:glutathione S-transferase